MSTCATQAPVRWSNSTGDTEVEESQTGRQVSMLLSGHRFCSELLSMICTGWLTEVFTAGPTSGTEKVADPTIVAVTGDQTNTEYVYFESAPGAFIRGDVNPTTVANWTSFVPQGYGLPAPGVGQSGGQGTAIQFVNGDPMFLYQDTIGNIRVYDISRQNSEVFNTTLSSA